MRILTLSFLLISCSTLTSLNKKTGTVKLSKLSKNAKISEQDKNLKLKRRVTFYHSPYITTIDLVPTVGDISIQDGVNEKNFPFLKEKLSCFEVYIDSNSEASTKSESWKFIIKNKFKSYPAQLQGVSVQGLSQGGRLGSGTINHISRASRQRYEAKSIICSKKIDLTKGFEVTVNPSFSSEEELSWLVLN